MNADVTKGVDGIKMKLDEAIFFGQGNGSPSRVCFDVAHLMKPYETIVIVFGKMVAIVV